MDVRLESIVKRYGDLVANDGVNLSVAAGTVHALVGENGAGKSTLMNVLYGMTRPDSGRIVIDGVPVEIRSPLAAIARGLGMVHQDFLLVPRFSVAENVALGGSNPVSRRRRWRDEVPQVARRIRELGDRYGLDVDPDARVSELSVGAQQRVEIMKLLVRDARTLILDEPTGVLTPQEADGLFEVVRTLAHDGRSIVVITHKLNEIFGFTDAVTVMRAGRDVLHAPTVSTTPDALAHAMVGERAPLVAHRGATASGEVGLEVRGLTHRDPRGVERLRDITFGVARGEIVGIAGVDGNGQSELAEAVAGLVTVERGEVVIAGHPADDAGPAQRRRLGLGYVPADRRSVGSVHEFSVAENLAIGRVSRYRGRGGRFLRRRLHEDAHRVVEDFDVRTPGVDFAAGQLSGGNLQKLIVGRELADDPSVLVFEQPTRGLDLRATDAVRSTILAARDRGAAVLVISADLDEILTLSDRILVMFDGRIVGERRAPVDEVDEIGLLMAGVAS